MREYNKTIFYRNNTQQYDSGTEEEEETAQEKRLRLAKKYLQEIEEKGTIWNMYNIVLSYYKKIYSRKMFTQ